MSKVTESMEEVEFHMSNFDYSIDDGMAECLMDRPAKVYGAHTAWNFFGRVWYEDGKFHEEVLRNCVVRGHYSADTLEELMEIVSNKYGWE